MYNSIAIDMKKTYATLVFEGKYGVAFIVHFIPTMIFLIAVTLYSTVNTCVTLAVMELKNAEGTSGSCIAEIYSSIFTIIVVFSFCICTMYFIKLKMPSSLHDVI